MRANLFLITTLVFLFSINLYSQILPKEGSRLNYRLVGFSINETPKEQVYNIEIAKGKINDMTTFSNSIVQVYECTGMKNILEVPFFGLDYTWRVVYKKFQNTNGISFHHFSTLSNEHVDTSKLRLRVIQSSSPEYREHFVSVDAGGVLYDMKGMPVWFIPDTNGIGGYLGDLQLTPQNTFTFIRDIDAYEIDFNANVLWKAPEHNIISGNASHEKYHHEFRRLPNGHYILLGMQMVMCKQVTKKDTSYIITSKDAAPVDGFKNARFGTIVEYDEKGKLVWSWKSLDHLIGTDFDYFDGGIDSTLRFDPHDNSFYFDESKKVIYLSFRNLNRIMKIEYPSGKVLGFYGDAYKTGYNEKGRGYFCNPHNIGRTSDGLLSYFNNNSCENRDSLPTVVLLQEPSHEGDSLRKVWEYTCTTDGNKPMKFPSGGSVIELPDQSLFVCMGSYYSKVFIVTRNKEIKWIAIPEVYLESDRKWKPNKQYRANIISRNTMEKLIWNAESGPIFSR